MIEEPEVELSSLEVAYQRAFERDCDDTWEPYDPLADEEAEYEESWDAMDGWGYEEDPYAYEMDEEYMGYDDEPWEMVEEWSYSEDPYGHAHMDYY